VDAQTVAAMHVEYVNALIFSVHFGTLKFFHHVNVDSFFNFSADCAKLTPISRYYLCGSPFTCMISSYLNSFLSYNAAFIVSCLSQGKF